MMSSGWSTERQLFRYKIVLNNFRTGKKKENNGRFGLRRHTAVFQLIGTLSAQSQMTDLLLTLKYFVTF